MWQGTNSNWHKQLAFGDVEIPRSGKSLGIVLMLTGLSCNVDINVNIANISKNHRINRALS